MGSLIYKVKQLFFEKETFREYSIKLVLI